MSTLAQPQRNRPSSEASASSRTGSPSRTTVRLSPGDTVIIRSQNSQTLIVRGRSCNAPSESTLSLPPRPTTTTANAPTNGASAKVTDLTPQEIAQIANRAQAPEQRALFSTFKKLQDNVTLARAALTAHDSGVFEKFWGRCKKWLAARMGRPTEAPAPQRADLETHISTTISQRKSFSDRVIQPIIDPIRHAHQGKTFERTSETPRALVLAAVPTEKVGKIISFEALREGVETLARSARVDYVHLIKNLGEDRMAISRFNREGQKETLEFSFRRRGKVDVVLNGRVIGNLWTDDAMEAARLFAKGGTVSLKQKRHTAYTVH